MAEDEEKTKLEDEIAPKEGQESQPLRQTGQLSVQFSEPNKRSGSPPVDRELKSSSIKGGRGSPHVPKKYDHLIHSHLQISLPAVQRLVVAMDSNNDGRVTLEDIITYAHKHHLFLKEELLEGIFYDAIANRSFKTRKGFENPTEPLTAEEIHNAVRLSMQKSQDHWEEKGRSRRDIWLLLFETISGNLADTRDRLPRLELGPIKGLNETSKYSYFPSLPQMKAKIHARDPKPAPFSPPHRTEAGIVIRNTENIMEIFLDKEKYDSKKVDPLNTIVNARFHSIDDREMSVNSYDTIGFDTQQYFNEGYRLSLNPKLLKRSERHPIFSFVPENFNFSADKEMQEKLREKERLYELERNYNPLLDSPFERTFSDKETPASSGKKKTEKSEFEKSKYGFPEEEMRALENSYSKGMLMSIMRNKEREMAFELRKKQYMSQKIKKAQEEEGGDPKKLLFHTWFKNEDCETLKKRLAQTEPIKNPYNPPSAHQFRDDIPSENKPLFKTRFKDSVLGQKVELKAEDLVPKEVLLRSQKDKLNSDKREQENLEEFLGKKSDKKDWVHFFPLADKRRNFADMKLPEFIEKGSYNEPIEILNTLLRGEQGFEIPFRLYHKPLRTYDKNMFMGDIKASKF